MLVEIVAILGSQQLPPDTKTYQGISAYKSTILEHFSATRIRGLSKELDEIINHINPSKLQNHLKH